MLDSSRSTAIEAAGGLVLLAFTVGALLVTRRYPTDDASKGSFKFIPLRREHSQHQAREPPRPGHAREVLAEALNTCDGHESARNDAGPILGSESGLSSVEGRAEPELVAETTHEDEATIRSAISDNGTVKADTRFTTADETGEGNFSVAVGAVARPDSAEAYASDSYATAIAGSTLLSGSFIFPSCSSITSIPTNDYSPSLSTSSSIAELDVLSLHDTSALSALSVMSDCSVRSLSDVSLKPSRFPPNVANATATRADVCGELWPRQPRHRNVNSDLKACLHAEKGRGV